MFCYFSIEDFCAFCLFCPPPSPLSQYDILVQKCHIALHTVHDTVQSHYKCHFLSAAINISATFFSDKLEGQVIKQKLQYYLLGSYSINFPYCSSTVCTIAAYMWYYKKFNVLYFLFLCYCSICMLLYILIILLSILLWINFMYSPFMTFELVLTSNWPILYKCHIHYNWHFFWCILPELISRLYCMLKVFRIRNFPLSLHT